MPKILFVCLGNICRSPMAEFVMKQLVAERGLARHFTIASAATEKYNELCHEGLDYRAADMLRQMNVPFTPHFSHYLRPSDYAKFDYILAMDDANVRDILAIFGGDKDHKVHRLLDFTAHPRPIRDPWYTGHFEDTYWDIVDGCEALLEYLNKHDLL